MRSSSFLDGTSSGAAGCVGAPLSPLGALANSPRGALLPTESSTTVSTTSADSRWVAAANAGPRAPAGDRVLDRRGRGSCGDPPEANIRPIGVLHALPLG
eukprot:22475-Pyramimonas_sp.AAC.1